MKIEHGKYYVRTDGEIVGPAVKSPLTSRFWLANDIGDAREYEENGSGFRSDLKIKSEASDQQAIEMMNSRRVAYEARDRARDRQPKEMENSVSDFLGLAVTGYEKLGTVLAEARDQAESGKGKERHANNNPFDRQPIMEIGRMVGPGYNIGQSMKKQQEAMRMMERGDIDKAVFELLGAINYTAAAVLLMRERLK